MSFYISIIIPTCNRNDLLSKCLDLLIPDIQNVDGFKYEVIVTDDSKGHIAREMMDDRYPWGKWISGPQKGPAANRNNGANYAKGDWLIFIDDDCIPDHNMISAYSNAILQNPDGKVFEGCTIVDREKERFDEEAPLNMHGGYMFSCNFAISTAYFRSLHGFDEKFPYPAMEDSELVYRIKKDNVNIIFIADAIVLHPWRTKKKWFNMTLKRFDSALYFVKKHPQELENFGFSYYARAFFHSVVYTVKYSVKYKFRGIIGQIIYDFMQVYFAFYMLFV